MKLYTEEQLNKAMLDYIQGKTRHDIMNSLTPIELPSDEEIGESAPYVPRDAHDYYVGHKDGFIDGAKWVIEKLKQNKQ